MTLNYSQLVAYIDGLYADGSLSEQDYNDIIIYILANGDVENAPRDLIQIRRGNEADIPNLAQGELGYTLDTENLFVGGLNGNVNVGGKANLITKYGAKGNGVSNDTQAFIDASAATENDYIIIPKGNYIVDTFSSDKVLLFDEGAKLFVNTLQTVILQEVVAQPNQVIFDGFGDVILEKVGLVYCNWWGVNGTDDFGLRMNECFENTPNAKKYSAEGFHTIKTSVNMTNGKDSNGNWRHMEYDFRNCWFELEVNGKAVFDTTSNRFFTIKNLRGISRNASAIPKVGLLMSRDAAGASGGEALLENVYLNGSYTLAVYFNHSIEVVTHNKCYFNNDYVGARGVILTGKNSYGVTSDYVPVFGNTYISATQFVFNACNVAGTMVKNGNKEGVLLIDGCGALTFTNLYSKSDADAHIELRLVDGSVSNLIIEGWQAESFNGVNADYGIVGYGNKTLSSVKISHGNTYFINEMFYSDEMQYIQNIDIHSSRGFKLVKTIYPTRVYGANLKLGQAIDVSTIDWFSGQLDVASIDNVSMCVNFNGEIHSNDANTGSFIKKQAEQFVRRNKTIVGGVITVDGSFVHIIPEGGTTDDLDTIEFDVDLQSLYANHGQVLYLALANTSHTVTINHNTGNIYTNGAPVTLTGVKMLQFIYRSDLSRWVLVGV